MGKFVGKNSRVARILSLGIEHRTAVDPVPAAMGWAQQVLFQLRVLRLGFLLDRDVGVGHFAHRKRHSLAMLAPVSQELRLATNRC